MIGAVGCGAAEPQTAAADQETGDVSAELSVVPAGVLCVRITYSQSATTQKTFTVAAGSTAPLALGKLPTGPTTFRAEAFNVACSSVTSTTAADWATPADVSATVVLGVNTPLKFTLRPNVSATAQIDFQSLPSRIVAGDTNTFALMGDGTTRAWGDAIASGDGVGHLVPTTITQLASYTSIAGSFGRFACGIQAGNAYCWGENADRQFSGVAAGVYATPVSVGGGNTWVQLAAGRRHVCGLKTDGVVYCVGANESGQIGNGTASTVTTFVSVLPGVAQVAAGYAHTCALKNDGSVWCWGSNSNGQLGDGTTLTRFAPTRALLALGTSSLSLGAMHSCARREDGQAYCWGSNVYGQLGDATLLSRSTPFGLVVNPVDRVVAGLNHTCLIKDGTLNCFGNDEQGAVGVLPPSVDVTYVWAPKPILSGATDLAAAEHTCAVLGGAGTGQAVQCWGLNSSGQLGDGTNATRFRPANVVW
jgi:hypothetical protein